MSAKEIARMIGLTERQVKRAASEAIGVTGCKGSDRVVRYKTAEIDMILIQLGLSPASYHGKG